MPRYTGQTAFLFRHNAKELGIGQVRPKAAPADFEAMLAQCEALVLG